MAKKLQRVFRDRRLTPQEVAADNDVRTRVKAEHIPAHARVQANTLTELLKNSLRDSQKSIDQIAGESGVSASLITSFLSGERDIHMTTADKLADSLGLELAVE
jgi:transcriptional regulator with XRE-family HTH domain